MSKKTVLSTFISALLLVSALDAGAAHAQSPAKPELKVGFVPGPYIDGFKANGRDANGSKGELAPSSFQEGPGIYWRGK